MKIWKQSASIGIFAIIVLVFTACSGKKSADYSKILQGDLSDFAGTWVMSGGDDRRELGADGRINGRW